MIDTTTDTQLLPMADAVERETGWRPHITTLLRWSQRKRNQLRTAKVGGKRLTCRAWVREFIDAETRQTTNSPVVSRADDVARADREIDLLTAPARRGRTSKVKATVA